jgi:hypothetical protein
VRRAIRGYDCADLDEALEVASKHPVAAFGTLELRPSRTRDTSAQVDIPDWPKPTGSFR